VRQRKRAVVTEGWHMDSRRRLTEVGMPVELVASSRRDGRSADDDARADEYVELIQLIGDGGWHPGDIVRTATGVTWQFRETPYTTEFPEQEATSRSSARWAPRQSTISRLRRGPLTGTR
jgi:hypothetical protein